MTNEEALEVRETLAWHNGHAAGVAAAADALMRQAQRAFAEGDDERASHLRSASGYAAGAPEDEAGLGYPGPSPGSSDVERAWHRLVTSPVPPRLADALRALAQTVAERDDTGPLGWAAGTRGPAGDVVREWLGQGEE